MPSEADRLTAEGTRVARADGGEAVLRFTLRALKRCEDRYGSLDATVEELQWLIQQGATGFPDPTVGRILDMVATVTGEDADVASPPAECIDALLGAWLEAFPEPEGKADGEATAPRSPGAPGGGSPSATHT